MGIRETRTGMSDNPHIEKTREKAHQYKDRILYHLTNYSSIEEPITSKRFQDIWGISDITVRQAVGKLRDEGHPIGSGSKGFFIARIPKELESTIKNLSERLAVISRRKEKLIRAKIRLGEDGLSLIHI